MCLDVPDNDRCWNEIAIAMPIKVFYSYSHEDERYRKKLEKQLSILQREGTIVGWHDRQIEAGTEWEEQILKQLESAHIILLLISSSFIASDYCYDKEMTRALERHENGDAVVIPVIVRPVDWETAPFSKLPVLPKDGKAITKWRPQDDGFLDVARGIRKAAESLRNRPTKPGNPFTWRGGITDPEAFLDREQEERTLRDYLRGKQNCQIVGARRIGKTSLLRQVERIAAAWIPSAVVAYIDLHDPRCITLAGWLKLVAKRWGWTEPASDLADFADRVEAMREAGQVPVLCLDEFEQLVARPEEFTPDFLKGLRSCSQQGMPIVTASKRKLSDLTDPGDATSAFFNIFPLLPLGRFSERDAADFVTVQRKGVSPFTEDERKAILSFAGGHPLALQVACFHVVESRQNGDRLEAALCRAADDMNAHLPGSWASDPL